MNDDLNDGVQIILNRMKTNPEEFFDNGGRWQWIFKDTLREVLTEIEKAALFEGLKQVRRAEITAKAAATVLRANEPEEKTDPWAGAQASVTSRFMTNQSNGTSAELIRPKKNSISEFADWVKE